MDAKTASYPNAFLRQPLADRAVQIKAGLLRIWKREYPFLTFLRQDTWSSFQKVDFIAVRFVYFVSSATCSCANYNYGSDTGGNFV